jgi:hypothetical protein
MNLSSQLTQFFCSDFHKDFKGQKTILLNATDKHTKHKQKELDL